MRGESRHELYEEFPVRSDTLPENDEVAWRQQRESFVEAFRREGRRGKMLALCAGVVVETQRFLHIDELGLDIVMPFPVVEDVTVVLGLQNRPAKFVRVSALAVVSRDEGSEVVPADPGKDVVFEIQHALRDDGAALDNLRHNTLVGPRRELFCFPIRDECEQLHRDAGAFTAVHAMNQKT